MPAAICRAELLSELQRLADELGRTPRTKDMNQEGKYSQQPYRTKFGSWNDALLAAGLEPNQRKNPSKDKLVSALRCVADELGRTPTQSDIRHHSKFSVRPFNTEFGAISFAVEAAGMEPKWNNLSRQALIDELKRLGDELGRPPFTYDMVDHGRWGIMPYYGEFGGWGEALESAGFELPARPFLTDGTYGAGWNDTTRERVRERDGKQCVDCGMTQSTHIEKYGRRLDVHHIVPAHAVTDPQTRNDDSNLITLCAACHVKWERVRGLRRVPDGVTLPEYVSPPQPG